MSSLEEENENAIWMIYYSFYLWVCTPLHLFDKLLVLFQLAHHTRAKVDLKKKRKKASNNH